jgi:hypothetical protein
MRPTPYRLLIVNLLALVVLIAVSAARDAAAAPSTPGGVRVIDDGNWVYLSEVSVGYGTVTVTGGVTVRKIPLGYVLDVTWTGSNHTWVDVDVHRTQAPIGAGMIAPDGFSDGGD